MKMAEVCKVFQDIGVKDVSSVLASGNIIFSSDDSAENLKTKLEKNFQNISIMKLFFLSEMKQK